MGAAPSGRLSVDDVRTQAMLKDSDTFEFFIYKDKEMTQLMAQLEKGVSLLASQMRPAVLSNISMKPANDRVQVITDHSFTFTTASELTSGAAFKVRLPYELEP